MAETRKSGDKADIKSTRDVLKQWNEFYIKNKFGIGIQCEKCQKWRKVLQYQDESEVPDIWICSMWQMDENRRGSCSMPSDLTEADFVEDLYSPGSLVYAKMHGYPWWPAMIEDCPDNQRYFLNYVDAEDEYHVNFFGSKPLRNWIKATHLKDFTPPPTVKKNNKMRRRSKAPRARRNKDLEKSIQQANEALQMPVEERLRNFSFAVRYQGHWARVEELDKVELPPDCWKRKESSENPDREENIEPSQEEDSPAHDREENMEPSNEDSPVHDREENMEPIEEDSPVHDREENMEPIEEDSPVHDRENMEPSEEENSPVHDDISMSSDREDELPPRVKAYREYLNTIRFDDYKDAESSSDDNSPIVNDAESSSGDDNPPIVDEADDESLSCNDTDNNFSNGNSNLAIDDKHAGTISENDTANNHVIASEYSRNDSDAYILATDPSLLRTPYPSYSKSKNEQLSENYIVIKHGIAAENSQKDSDYILNSGLLMRTPYQSCSTPKNKQFPSPCERFKKNQELIDKLVNSNNSKYMPYSFYRERMKK